MKAVTKVGSFPRKACNRCNGTGILWGHSCDAPLEVRVPLPDGRHGKLPHPDTSPIRCSCVKPRIQKFYVNNS